MYSNVWVQIWTLVHKCLILLKRSWWWTFFRSFLLPVAYIVFMGESQNFFVPYADYGISSPNQIYDLASKVGDKLLIYYSPDGVTDEMRKVTNTAFNGVPKSQIHELSDPDNIFKLCRENFQGTSQCFGGIQWNEISGKKYNYTIRGNSGMNQVDVGHHESAVDQYVVPLQWAVDSAITGLEKPQTISFTRKSQDYYDKQKNRTFTGIVQDWLAPALFLGMIGVVYHLSGVVAGEREKGISNLLSAMGVGSFARLCAYHLAFSAVYLIGWIVIGLALGLIIFTNSNVAIFVFYHIISGLGIVSYSLVLGSLWRSAQLAGIVSSGVSVILAIAMTLQTKVGDDGPHQPGAIYALSFLFPPTNYAYFISESARWQREELAQNMAKGTPDASVKTIIIFVAAIVQIFLYFGLAMLTEQMHGVAKAPAADDENAVTITNLQKKYRKNVAVNDLSLTVAWGQILVLLGANGSGKTTTLDMVSGIQRPTAGKISLGKGSKLGICPQKNVLWDNMTVREHVDIWAGIKGVKPSERNAAVDTWIGNCDLNEKSKTQSRYLSGGQKRKLQLAVTFVGGSDVCCIDEVSSGLDPVSRRKIWDIILGQECSIILTTHFLDEADLLADKVAIMSKGNLRAEGSTVHLKQSIGGYRVFTQGEENMVDEKDVSQEVEKLESEGHEYKIAGPELEDVFLKFAIEDHDEDFANYSKPHQLNVETREKKIGMVRQTVAMFRKRLIIFRRMPLAELATALIPIIVAAATRTFLINFQGSGCSAKDRYGEQEYSPVGFANMDLVADSGVRSKRDGLESFAQGMTTSGNISTQEVMGAMLKNTSFVSSFGAFEKYIGQHYKSIQPGGMFLDPPTAAYRVDSSSFGVYEAPVVMNLLNNVRANGDVQLVTNFSPFQVPWAPGTGDTLQFIVYFGLAMSVAPAFLSLYPTFERLSKVRAMHYSNGLRIIPLWAAYTIFNFCFIVVASAIVVAIIGTATSHLIGIGYLFVCLLLYGLASTLLSYIFSLFVQSQLAAFAMAAATQAIYFLLYLVAYFCISSFGDPTTMPNNILISHFTIAIPLPVASLTRALFVSINLFGVLCQGNGDEVTYMGDIEAYGGPILYMVVQSIVYFAFIVWWDSGKYRPRIKRKVKEDDELQEKQPSPEVEEETRLVESDPDHYDAGVRLTHVSKVYGRHAVVDDVTFGVGQDECFALLGPNGAGKSTTFNMIRGEEYLSQGTIHVNGVSVSSDRTLARTRLGVCPQFDAMDKMKVVEILNFYGRLRGLSNVREHVNEIIDAVGISRFRDQMAHKLSGGNKRKLSLGIALIGDPSVLLLDEPSSGMDAFAKRIMWKTLERVSKHRSIILTTHSMEEADALAHRAGILSRKLLTVGTTDHLRHAYGHAYHVHLICKSTAQHDLEAALEWVRDALPTAEITGRAFQGQIKLKVPADYKLSDLFKLLERNRHVIESFSISNTTLEEVFLKIVT